ncbi:uncharacterized protein PHALS_15153 [Plasmopara halstedii]|uniref:Uncharacterized protein n=1 Tax=Plasmopara halstedii TaxID=4781 RepID=A0A0P1B126_PLAHL|nr:uncharacterized protein PHALS_15153 [Plasmopara halstedii]CEG48436.1 hypothetical protein PHALS_15153 [Plasmopara halstedii]|eukprot:XP_024584805.1 hypothetical protein PHALS_15153 [Plasmopara halstedii]
MRHKQALVTINAPSKVDFWFIKLTVGHVLMLRHKQNFPKHRKDANQKNSIEWLTRSRTLLDESNSLFGCRATADR